MRSTSLLNNAPRFSRRAVLAGGAAAGLMLTRPAFASTQQRVFEVYRGSSDIGRHSVSAEPDGDLLRVTIEIDLAVRVLGITAYRYEHVNREVWQGGQLVSLTSETNDDGEEAFCRIQRGATAFRVEGSSYAGDVDFGAAPTSYWNYANLDATTWISSQSGKPLAVTVAPGEAVDGLERRMVTGDLDVTLFYDAEGEWRTAAFDGNGAEITYREVAPGPQFSALL